MADLLDNGDRAWQLLLAKIEGVHHEVREARSDIQGVRERVARVETRVDALPCPAQVKRIAKIEGVVLKQTAVAGVAAALASGVTLALAWLTGWIKIRGGAP